MKQKVISLEDLSWVILAMLNQHGVEFDADITRSFTAVEAKGEENAAAYWWLDKASVDASPTEGADEKELGWSSDRGEGVESLVRQVDYVLTNGASECKIKSRAQILHAARQRIRRNKPHCLEVFNLIIKNGSNREESICQMIQNVKAKRQCAKGTSVTSRS